MVTRIVKNFGSFTIPGSQTADLSNPRATANIRRLSPTQRANLNAAQEKLRSEGDYKGARLIGRDARGTGTLRFAGHDLEGNRIFEGPELPDVPPPPPSGRTVDHFQNMARRKEQALAQAASDAAKEAADAARGAETLKKDPPKMDQRPISPLPVPLKRGGKVNSASSRGDGIAQRGKTRGKMC